MDLTQASTLLLFFCKPSALVSPRSCASSTSITHLIDVESHVLCCAATLQINQPELFSLQPLRPIEHLSLVLHYSVLPQRAWGKKQGASMGFGAWYGLQPKNSAVFRAVLRSMQTHLFEFRCRWMSLDNKHGFIFCWLWFSEIFRPFNNALLSICTIEKWKTSQNCFRQEIGVTISSEEYLNHNRLTLEGFFYCLFFFK